MKESKVLMCPECQSTDLTPHYCRIESCVMFTCTECGNTADWEDFDTECEFCSDDEDILIIKVGK